MTKITREYILEQLQRNPEVLVIFTKKNGETREMRCTQSSDLIPPTEQPKNSNGDQKKYPENQIRVYDLEKSAWRSFLVESVMAIDWNPDA